MTDKTFYVTIEVTAQTSGSLQDDNEKNREEYRKRIIDYFYDVKRKNKMDYNFYIHRDNILAINDEKGRTL